MSDIRRREFITLVGAAAMWPLAARVHHAARRRGGNVAGGGGRANIQKRAAG